MLHIVAARQQVLGVGQRVTVANEIDFRAAVLGAQEGVHLFRAQRCGMPALVVRLMLFVRLVRAFMGVGWHG
ncbi:MAG: hypothetical protein PVSMB4_06150 [Ktedonobacterales bacterium]